MKIRYNLHLQIASVKKYVNINNKNVQIFSNKTVKLYKGT